MGEDWLNSDYEQAEVLVLETPEQYLPTYQVFPTMPILSGSSESIRLPQAPRRNRIGEASRRILFEEDTWDF